MATPLDASSTLTGKIDELQEQLEKKLPGYKDVLRSIHSIIKNDPDLLHILTDEQIGVIVAGLSQHKGVVIVKAEARKAVAGTGKRKGSVGVEDI